MNTASLTDCVVSGDYSALRSLLHMRADANEKDSAGQAPLLRASNNLDVDMCRELLWAQADANTMSSDQRTALHKVAISGSFCLCDIRASGSGSHATNIQKGVQVARLLMGARDQPPHTYRLAIRVG